MNKNLLYVNLDIDNKKCVFSGIALDDIWNSLGNQIHNILLIKSETMGNDCQKNFELAEGKECIEKIIHEYKFGEFCFADFEDPSKLELLTDQQIAEILFFGHMHRPLNKAVFENLNNKFVYIGNDNTFFCKLYFYDINNICIIIKDKLEGYIKNKLKKYITIKEELLLELLYETSGNGLLVDFSEIEIREKSIWVYIYCVEKTDDMDRVINNKILFKERGIKKHLQIIL